jgi:PKD repeat protein
MKPEYAMSKKLFIPGWIAFLGSLVPGTVWAIGESCDFQGTATYKGRAVTSSDVIRATDSGGQNCTNNVYYFAAGYVVVVVNGDDPSTTTVDEGAPEGGTITFTINGETATPTGSSTFHNLVPQDVNLDVPDLPPHAVPGGPYSGNEGSSVSFNGSGSTGGVSYLWRFGDGQTGTGVTASHTYVDEGTYTVKLIVTNGSGVKDSSSTVANIANVKPTASASSNAPKYEGETVTFSGSATDPGTSDVLSYSWTFGDGGSSSLQNPTHVYGDNGVFSAALTVSDGDGGTDSKSVSVTINNAAPTVNASSDAPKNEGQTVTFTCTATDPGGLNDPLTYAWTFGDGGTSTAQNPTHVYADNGTFSATVTVSDGDGGSTPKSVSVAIANAAPAANINGPYYGVVNYPVQFHGTATDPGAADVLTYTWDLDNDGAYDDFTGQNPTKTWTSLGTYTIGLRVADDDGGSDTKSTTVEVGTGIPVTFQTDPAGLQVKVDGETVTTPRTYYWGNGTSHSIEAPILQTAGEGTRYFYTNWSDGGLIAHSITVGTSPVTYTAEYKVQYYLGVLDGRGGAAHPVGSDWYDPGTQVQISVDATALDEAGTTRYQFNRWQGTGNGSYSGTQLHATVTMNGPVIEQAVWGAGEYYVTVASPYGTTTGSGWYAAGAAASFSVGTDVATGPGRRQAFVRWVGQGTDSYTGPLNPGSITVHAPVVETAEWKVEYFLDIVSDYGAPTGEGWYAEGGVASIGCDSTVAIQTGRRARFAGWFGSGTGAYTGPLRQKTLTVTAPVTETVQWGTQYMLAVISEYGSPAGSGWYNEGVRARFSCDTLVQSGADVRNRFKGWQGVGGGSYTGTDPSGEVVMLNAVTEEADWDQEYRISIAIDPAGTGSVQPFASGSGWSPSGGTVELRALGRADLGYGFNYWSGSASGNANPLSLPVDGPKSLTAHFKQGNVFITTDPPGLLVRINGASAAAPVVFDAAAGTSISVSVDSLQGDAVSTRYAFRGWSDGLPRSHSITATGSTQRLTASFGSQYFVNVVSDYGSPSGEGWYESGASAAVRIDTAAAVTPNARQRFAGWTGTGPGSVTSGTPEIRFAVTGPVTERARWDAQCRIKTSVFPAEVPGASIRRNPDFDWYTLGSTLTLTAVASDPAHPFQSWKGDVTSADNPLVLVIARPMTVVGRFYVPDDPPAVRGFPNLVIKEDETKIYSFDWLSQYVVDPNDPVETLTLEFTGAEHVLFSIAYTERTLTVRPARDWNGTETVAITAIDPFGISDSDTFTVKILPVEDAPAAFGLIYPLQDTTLDRWNIPLEFRWHSASDPDSGDAVKYSFLLTDTPELTGTGIFKMSLISDTVLFVSPRAAGEYYWGVVAQDTKGNSTVCDVVHHFRFTPDAVETDRGGKVPDRFSLDPNYPNPFNPSTAIPFRVARPGRVRLMIFDLMGRVVRTLEDGSFTPGTYESRWDGLDESGRTAASGVYVIAIQAGDFTAQRKMLLMR